MKKSLVILFGMMLALTLTLSLVVSVPALAQKSTALMGDKSVSDVDRSTKVFKSRIADLKNEIVNLENERDKKVAKYETSRNHMAHTNPGYYEAEITKADTLIKRCEKNTDHLIAVYQQKILELDDQLSAFTINVAGKDQQNVMALKSRNVSEFADAYMTIKYADNLSSNSKADPNSVSMGRELQGIVENASYLSPVVVRITGPAQFSVEYTLEAKEKSPEFTMPCIGCYTATFTSSYGVRCVTKRVWPNSVYYDNGQAFGFKATLLP